MLLSAIEYVTVPFGASVAEDALLVIFMSGSTINVWSAGLALVITCPIEPWLVRVAMLMMLVFRVFAAIPLTTTENAISNCSSLAVACTYVAGNVKLTVLVPEV